MSSSRRAMAFGRRCVGVPGHPSLWHLSATLLFAALAACSGDSPPELLPTGPEVATGSISVILGHEGEGNDADGVTVSLWAGSLVSAKSAMLGDTIAFGELPAGAYTVSVAGLDPLCRGDVADVIEVKARSNTLRLQNECVGRLLYEKEFSQSRLAVVYVDAESRVRTLALEGIQHVRGTSPDGERALVEEWQVAACGTRKQSAIATLAGGVTPLQQNPRRPVTAGATWSPTGRLIAAREEGSVACGDSDERAILLYDPDTGAPVRTVADGVADVLGPDVAWSPEGGRLAYVRDNVILAYDVDTGGLSQLYAAAATQRPQELAWAPSGRYLLFRPAPQASLEILDLTNGSVMALPLASAAAPAWHPTGNFLAVEGRNPDGVFVFDIQNQTLTPASTDAIAQASHPSWNAAGDQLLLSGRSGSGARALQVVNWPEGSAWQMLEGDDGGPQRARWTRWSTGP